MSSARRFYANGRRAVRMFAVVSGGQLSADCGNPMAAIPSYPRLCSAT
jgi:hypothetical protein